MSKKNKQTFASRAKSLISKYSRADFDQTEKAELDNALSKLSEEQELYKQTNKIGEYSNNANGVNMKHDGMSPGSTSYITDFSDPLAFSDSLNLKLSNPEYNPIQKGKYGLGLSSDQGAVADDGLSPYSTSITPSLVSGATSVIGNLMLANKAKDYKKLNLPKVTSEKVNLSNERRSAERQADIARANILRNIKSGSKTRGELLSNMIASDAARQRNLSDIIGGSYQRESQMNAAERARASQTNAQMSSQEAQYNANLANKAMQDKQQYQAAAMQSIPQTFKDIAAIQQQDALINSLGQNYGAFKEDYEGRKWYQPKRLTYKYKG